MTGLNKRYISEFLGTAGLLIVIVGSGIMAQSLSGGHQGIALLANAVATGAGLYALIQTFVSISGAHFNPVVSLVDYVCRRISAKDLVGYTLAQLTGAVAGVLVTHCMFGLNIFQLSTQDRGDSRFLFSEVIATAGLILVISLSGKKSVHATPGAVALYILSAYWCTSSTSFANPAVTIARSLTDTFTGVLWTGVIGFIVAQLIGAGLGYGVSTVLTNSAFKK